MPSNRVSWIELVQHLRARWDFHSARSVLGTVLEACGLRVQALYDASEVERIADELAERTASDDGAHRVVMALRAEVRRLSSAA